MLGAACNVKAAGFSACCMIIRKKEKVKEKQLIVNPTASFQKAEELPLVSLIEFIVNSLEG